MSGEDLGDNRTIRFRQEDADPAIWQFLQASPGDNSGFHERSRYIFELPSTESIFHVDDEPLPPHSTNPRWTIWEPGFFAGEVTAELTASDGTRLALYLLDVEPEPGKLGRDIFTAMIRDIRDEDPALLLGEEPATIAGGEAGSEENLWLAFARLRRYGLLAVQALDAIRARPRRALQVRRESIPIHEVRRTDRQTVAVLRHSPGLLAALIDHQKNSGNIRDARLDVPRIEETLDSAANRALLAMIQKLLRKTINLREAIEAKVATGKTSDTRTALAGRWPRRRLFLEDLARKLNQALRLFPWREVRRAEVSAAGLTAVAADPVYSRAWSLGWKALRPGVDDENTVERLWISPSWEIYERWCFVKLGKMLGILLSGWNWRRKGKIWSAVQKGCRVELALQPVFRSDPDRSGGRWSVSRQRQPDILLTLQNGLATKFLVLDAKYSTSRLGAHQKLTTCAQLELPTPGAPPWPVSHRWTRRYHPRPRRGGGSLLVSIPGSFFASAEDLTGKHIETDGLCPHLSGFLTDRFAPVRMCPTPCTRRRRCPLARKTGFPERAPCRRTRPQSHERGFYPALGRGLRASLGPQSRRTGIYI